MAPAAEATPAAEPAAPAAGAGGATGGGASGAGGASGGVAATVGTGAGSKAKPKAAQGAVSAAAATALPSGNTPFSGSFVTLRNVATALSMAPSAEPTYNPYYAMSLSLAPNWNVNKQVYVRANLSMTRELTHEDWTTYAGETMLSDTTVTAGWRAVRLPSMGLSAAFEGSLALPTSKASRARTLQAGTGVGMTAVWAAGNFALIGITRVAYQWNRYTTGQTETPWLSGCASTASGCDPYITTGLRNPEWRFTNFGIVSWSPTAWVGLNLQGGVIADLLYDMSAGNSRAGAAVFAGDGANHRELMVYGLSAEFRPHKALTVAVGAETANPQLKPNSTYRAPFFNRFTTLFVDLQVAPDRLF